MLRILFLFLFWWTTLIPCIHAAPIVTSTTTINDINVRETSGVKSGNVDNTQLKNFISPLSDFFFTAGSTGWDGISSTFVYIAFQVKNFFILIAWVFLIVWVIKLLFSPAWEEDVKKWRNNIIWVSIGIFVMQISFSVWNTFILRSATSVLGSKLWYDIWINVFSPIVNLLQMLAWLGFIVMMIYAFYTIVTGGGDEEKLKKWKSTVIYAALGFFLIKIPDLLVKSIYGIPNCNTSSFMSYGDCAIEKQNLSWAIQIVGKIFNYFNSFLAITCVLLVIYAGWLVFISGGDEEKLKKAKNIILYIIIGFLVLVASHSLFKFFILKG